MGAAKQEHDRCSGQWSKNENEVEVLPLRIRDARGSAKDGEDNERRSSSHVCVRRSKQNRQQNQERDPGDDENIRTGEDRRERVRKRPGGANRRRRRERLEAEERNDRENFEECRLYKRAENSRGGESNQRHDSCSEATDRRCGCGSHSLAPKQKNRGDQR